MVKIAEFKYYNTKIAKIKMANLIWQNKTSTNNWIKKK